MGEYRGSRNERNGKWASIGDKNPNRVIGGHKAWRTQQAKRTSEGDLGAPVAVLGCLRAILDLMMLAGMGLWAVGWLDFVAPWRLLAMHRFQFALTVAWLVLWVIVSGIYLLGRRRK